MAIYKLSDVVGYIRGNSFFQKKDLLQDGDFLGLHYGKTYKLDIIDDTFPFYVLKKFKKENQIIKFGDTILITTSETVNELGKAVYFASNKDGLLGGEQIKVYPLNENLLLKKYLYYWFVRNFKLFQKFSNGVKVFRFKGSDFKFIDCNIPNLIDQQKIIDIIEPIEDAEKTLSNLSSKMLEFCEQIYKLSNKSKKLLKDISKIEIGGTPSTTNNSYWNGNIPWINSGLLTNSFITKPSSKYITELGMKKTKAANEGELLISIIEPSKNKVALASEFLTFNQSTAKISSFKNLYFEIMDIMWLFNKIKSGSAQQSINKDDIEKTKINLSSINFDYYLNIIASLNKMKLKLSVIKNKMICLLVK